MKTHTAILMLLAALLCACSDSTDEPEMARMPLVVEGWIEEGQPPVVTVTRAVDLTSNSPSFDEFIEKWCRVSVFDGDTRYILTGRKDDDYMPPYIYTTSRLKGKVGHTYRLLVETETDTLEAIATMPPAPRISSLEAIPTDEGDSLFSIRAHLSEVDTEGAYKFFAQCADDETRYYGTFLGTFKGSEYDESAGYSITRGIHSTYSDSTFLHFYPAGARVMVKICALPGELYEFWRIYDNSISLSQNIFFSFAENCKGNVSGGLGYWAAYGMSRKNIIIPQ